MRQWRKNARMSQLDLGLVANVSARHISFLESGRAKPSREMVLLLTDALTMPKNHANRAFLAAGFAPFYRQFPAGQPEHGQLQRAIDTMLSNHLPYPAIVMDNFWNIKQVNQSAGVLISQAGFADHENLIEAIIADDPKTSTITNWQESISLIVRRLKSELLQTGIEDELFHHCARLEQHLNAHFPKQKLAESAEAVIPTRFKFSGQTISVFSTIAQFSSVFDLAFADLKIELMFPADQASDQFFQMLAKETSAQFSNNV